MKFVVQGLTGYILLSQQVNYFKEIFWDSNCWLLTAAKTRLEVFLLGNFFNWRNHLKRGECVWWSADLIQPEKKLIQSNSNKIQKKTECFA